MSFALISMMFPLLLGLWLGLGVMGYGLMNANSNRDAFKPIRPACMVTVGASATQAGARKYFPTSGCKAGLPCFGMVFWK